MPTSIKIRTLKAAPPGKRIVQVIVESQRLSRFYVDVTIDDQGDGDRDLAEARRILREFAADFSEALKHPLRFSDEA